MYGLIVFLAFTLAVMPVSAQETTKRGWSVSPGSVTTGFNLENGNLLNGLGNLSVNLNLIQYNKSAKYTLHEKNLASSSGTSEDGKSSYNATLDTFTGIRANGFAGVGADLSWKPMSLEEKLIAAEQEKSTGVQDVAGVAKRDCFKAATNDGEIIDNTVIMREGTEKFGWTHISYDREDGTNHARELRDVYGLDNNDEVKDLIMYAIETGDVQEQVRESNGQETRRYIVTKEIDGKPMKVVVDKGKYEGSVITAYPTKYKRDKQVDSGELEIPERYETPTTASRMQSFIGLQAGGDIFAGSELSGAVGASHTDKNDIKYSGSIGGALQAGALAKGKVYAGLKNGKDLVVGAQGDAFAGARASGAVSVGTEYKGVGARLTGSGHVGVGVGVTGKVEGKISWDGIKFDVDGQAYLGLGGGFGLSGEIKFGAAGEVVKKGVDKVVDVSQKTYATGKDLVVKTGTTIKNGFNDVKDKTVEVVDKVKDQSKIIKDNVKNTASNMASKVKGWFSF